MAKSFADALDVALERWNSVRNRLVDVIHEYAGASAELESALRTATSEDPPQKPLLDLDPLLRDLSQQEDTLREVRLRLNAAYDPIHAMTPIKMLHADILITIFTLATQERVSEDFQEIDDEPVSATTLASVCSTWRELIINAPIFWTELDLVLTGPLAESSYERATLWAQRARSAPLWLSIEDIVTDEDDFDRYPTGESLPESVISRVVKFSTPLMPFVRKFSIQIMSFSAISIARALLGCWIQHGSLDVSEELELVVDLDLPELDVPVMSPNIQVPDLPPSKLSAFLHSLKSFRVENVALNWAQPPFSGLTELHIEFAFESASLPTRQDISRLLEASPGLRSLILHNFSIRPGGPIPAPVALDHLEALGLETMAPSDIALVLPLISSTSSALRVALSMDDEDEFVCAVRLFLSRINVTVLYVDGSLPASDPLITALFVPMPHLHTLTIRACTVTAQVLHDFTHWCASDNQGKNPWPALRTLNLFDCETTEQVVEQVVQAHGLRTLGLHVPRQGINAIHWSEEWNNAYARAAMKESLAQRGVDLIWYSPSGNDLPSWSFVMS